MPKRLQEKMTPAQIARIKKIDELEHALISHKNLRADNLDRTHVYKLTPRYGD